MGTSRELFTLRLRHSFYQSGDCEDLEVVVPERTARLLRNHRCQWKSSPAGWSLRTTLAPDGTAPALPLPAGGLTVVLHLYRTGRYLEAYTSLPQYHRQTEVLQAAGAASSTEVALSWAATAKPNLRLPASFFAQVQVTLPSVALEDWPLRAAVALQPQEVTWKYFYIGEKHLPAPELLDTTGTLQFDSVAVADLDPTAEPLAAKLQNRYPEARHQLYRSTSPVAWREERYAGIQLLRGGIPIVNHLRNPNWETQGIEIINALPNH